MRWSKASTNEMETPMSNDNQDLALLALSSYLLLAKVQRVVIPFRGCQTIPHDAIVALNEAAIQFEKDWTDINNSMRNRRLGSISHDGRQG